MAGGMVSVSEICGENGAQILKPQGGDIVSVSFKDRIILPDYAILRRRTVCHD